MRNLKIAILVAVILLAGTLIAYQFRSLNGPSIGTLNMTMSAGGGGGKTGEAPGSSQDSETAGVPDDLPVSQSRAAAALAAASTPAANPRIASAQSVARARWSEFAEAWASRNDMQAFHIKKCFEEEGGVECLWCVVDKIDASTILGRLDNDPRILFGSLARGDEITCPVEEINDWMISDGPNIRGAFTERPADEPRP